MAFENFLDELFRSELCFQIHEEEVNFIKSGIETLVQIIADLVWENYLKTIEAETETLLNKFPDLHISRNGKYTLNDIVKAGSFYENTKNVYPDQFDFIFLMGVFESNGNFVETEKHLFPKISDLHNCFRELLASCEISFPSLTERMRFVRFDRYIERKGPSSKLRFIYGYDKTEKYIYVDLVPAFKVLLHGQIDDIANKCGIKGFIEEFKNSSSIILVQGHISFTETEVNFMKYKLSSKHVKAYRLLKYIMNGCYNENTQSMCFCKTELLRALGNTKPQLVPSYHLKIVAISHHFECLTDNCNLVAPCLLKMMEDVKNITLISSLKKLYELYIDRPLNMTGYRQELLETTIHSFKELNTLVTKRNSCETRNVDNLLGNSAVNYASLNDEGDKNDTEARVQHALLYSECKAPEGKLEKVKYNPLINIQDNKNNGNDVIASSFPFEGLHVRDSSIISQENPLLSNSSRETDDIHEHTKASDWFKTLSTYFSTLMLIVVSGVFAVLVLYVLTYRT